VSKNFATSTVITEDNQYLVKKKPEKKSNWGIFYDAIRRYPKFEKMITYIKQMNDIKQAEKEEIR
jgi:hypothetical protein